MESTDYSIAIIGGSGPQGKGLAYRLSRAGYRVVLGSREVARARSAATELSQLPGALTPIGSALNDEAARSAQTVLLAVPYEGHAELVRSLAPHLGGKTLISCVNPLGFDKDGPFALEVETGSAAEEAASLVPDAKVVGAFHHLSAPLLLDPEADLSHEDVLVCGNDAPAKESVMAIAAAVTEGRAVDAGRLRQARQLEPLTALLISVNKRYKTRAGIALTGVPQPSLERNVR